MSGRSIRAFGARFASVVVSLALLAGLTPALAEETATSEPVVPSESVEDPEGWSPFAHWWPNGDGTSTAQLFAQPHFTNTSGTWSPIDAAVAATSDVNLPLAAERAFRPVRFGRRAEQVMVLQLDKGPVVLSAAGLAVGSPELASDGTVLYRDVAADTDLRYRVDDGAVKEEIVLRSAGAPTTFRFHLADPSGQLGAATPIDGGGVRFDAVLDGEVAVELLAPFAYEPTDDGMPVGIDADSVTMDVVPATRGWDITVSVDAGWLADRSFPVVIDPTVRFVHNNGLAIHGYNYYSGKSSDPCYGGGCSVNVTAGDFGVGSYTMDGNDIRHLRSYFRFDLTRIKTNAIVDKATFAAYRQHCLGATYYYCDDYSYDVQLRRITASWSSSSTWSYLNTYTSSSYFDTLHFNPMAANTAEWRYWTGSLSTVRDWVKYPSNNRGFTMRLASEGTNIGGPMFHSGRNSSGKGPFLEVVYRTPPNVPSLKYPGNGAVLNSQPSYLRAVHSDPDGDSGTVYFELTKPDGTKTGGWSSSVCSGCSAYYYPPSGLATGTYKWRAYAKDAGGLTSSWSSSWSFRINNAPNVPDLKYPANGAYLTSAPSYLRAIYSDPDGDSGKLYFYLDKKKSDGTWGTHDHGPSSSTSVCSGCSAYFYPTATIDLGDYRWRAYATDKYGKSSGYSGYFYFTIHRAPATPTEPYPSDGAYRTSTPPYLRTRYSDPDGHSGTVSYWLYHKNADGTVGSLVASGTSAEVTSGSYAYFYDVPALATGTYTWRARARDVHGAYSPYTSYFTFTMHRKPDVPVLLEPPDGWVSSSAPTALKARYSDPDGHRGKVAFYLYERNADGTRGTLLASGWSVEVASGETAVFSAIPTLVEGSYLWRARARDVHAAYSDFSADFTFTLDATPPDVPTLKSPVDGAAVQAMPAKLVAGYRDANGQRGRIHARLEQADAAGLVWTTTDERWSGYVDSGTDASVATPSGLGEGVYRWQAKAEDTAGNASAYSSFAQFVVDATAPTAPGLVTSTTHLVHVPSSNRTVELDWTPGTDAGSGVASYWYALNQSESTAPDGSNSTTKLSTTVTIPQTSTDEQPWYFHVVTVDRAGNRSADKIYGPIIYDPDASPWPSPTLTDQPVAQSDEHGLEQFYAYDDLSLGATDGWVQLRTGNVVVQHEVANIPNQGLNSIVRLTYNTHRAAAGQQGLNDGAGLGWSLSVGDVEAGLEGLDGLVDGAITDLDLNAPIVGRDIVEVATDGTYVVVGGLLDLTDGDGTTHRFERDGGPGGYWRSPPGVSLRVFEELTEVVAADGTTEKVVDAYRLVRPDGVTYVARAVDNPSTGPKIHWRVTQVTDRNGNTLTYTYEPIGGVLEGVNAKFRISQVIHDRQPDPLITFAYDTAANLDRIVTLPGTTDERTVDITVDSSGQLTTIVDNAHLTDDDTGRAAGRRTTSFGYDPNSTVMAAVTDGRGNTTALTIEQDATGLRRLTGLTDRETYLWSWQYDTPDQTTGLQTTQSFTPRVAHGTDNGRAVTVYVTSGREPVNVADQRTFGNADPNDDRITGGNILEIRDPGNNTGPVATTFTWRQNRLVVTRNADGAETKLTYNHAGMLTGVTQPAPNRSSGATVPVDNLLRYRRPSGYSYPSGVCDEQTTFTSVEISREGACDAVFELTRAALATNYTDQLRITDFGYDTDGNLTRLVQRATPDLARDPTASTASGDRQTTFDYYTRGGLRSIDGPRLDVTDVTIYGQAAEGTVTDSTYGGYDLTGMPTVLKDAAGNTKRFTYSRYGMTLEVVDRDGNTIRNRYDARDNLTQVTDPLNHVTGYTYDGNDNKTAEIHPRTTSAGSNLRTAFTYDRNDRAARTEQPGGIVTTTVYHPDGTTQSDTGPRTDATTTYSYWPNGSVKTVDAPADGTARAVTDHEYDSVGRLVRQLTPAVNTAGNRPTVQISYTPQGQPASRSETSDSGAVDRTTDTIYNAHGEPVTVLGPRTVNGHRATSTTLYDRFGQPTRGSRTRSDGVAIHTNLVYDLAGNQTRLVQPFRTAASSDDATVERLVSTWRYDALNQLAEQTADPINPGHTVTYAYTGEGQQRERVDYVNGIKTRTATHTYNPDNTRRSLTVVDHAAGKTLATCNYRPAGTSGYDPDGNLTYTRTVDGTCSAGSLIREQTFVYDDAARIAGTDQRVRATDGTYDVTKKQTFGYDPDGTWTSVTHDGRTTTYANSPAGWNLSLTDWRGKTTTTAYLPSGAPKTQSLGGTGTAATVTGSFDYHADGMLKALSWTRPDATTIRSHTAIDYDTGGLRTGEQVSIRKTDGTQQTGGATWSHDLLDRLVGWASPFPYSQQITDRPSTAYTLDDSGNIERETTSSAGTVRVDADPAYEHGRLASKTTVTTPGDGIVSKSTDTEAYTYNGLGEETRRETNTDTEYVSALLVPSTLKTTTDTRYDPAGHTTSVKTASQVIAGELTAPDGTTVTYVYDTADRVIARTETTPTASKTTLYFYWAETGVIAEEADTAGRTKTRYLPDTDGQNIAQQTYSVDDSGNATTTGETWTWLLADSAANVATLLKDDGTVVEHKAFDPYGKPEPGGTDRQDTDAQGNPNPTTSLGFQSAHTDTTTGKVLLGPRQYDPTTARFTTPDIYIAGELDLQLATDTLTGNRYLFAAANPVAYFEDGHGPFTALRKIAKAAVPFIPVVGTAVDLVSAATGRDWLDGGRKLTGGERALLVGVAAVALIPGAGLAARAAVKGISKAKSFGKMATAASDVGVYLRLRKHTSTARRLVDAAGDEALTPGQFAAVLRNPRLRPAYRGNRIDVATRQLVMKDAWLRSRLIESNYSRGVDFRSRSGRWFDMTTTRQWDRHVARYGPRGWRIPTDANWSHRWRQLM